MKELDLAVPECTALFFEELDLVCRVLLQLMGKRHPLHAVCTLTKKNREEEENYFQLGCDSVLCARLNQSYTKL